MSIEGRRERIGHAAPATPIFVLHVVDDLAYFVTRSVEPTRVGVLDLRTNRVTAHAEIPTGTGAWALTSVSGDLFIGTYAEGDLYRFDPGTAKMSRIDRLQSDTHICDFSVENRRLYFGTYPTTNVYEYDTVTDELTELGPACSGEEYAREVAVADRELFVAVGSHAHLIRVDLETGGRTDVLPEEFEDENWVRNPIIHGDRLIYRTGNRLVISDRNDPTTYETAAVNDCELGVFDAQKNSVYVVATLEESDDIRLYRYHLETAAFKRIGRLPEGTFDLHVEGNRVVGANSAGTIWTYDLETGDRHVLDLATAGMPRGSEVPFSLAVVAGIPIVAGHKTLHVHDESDELPRRVGTLGEAKGMVAVEDTLYQAIYPGGKLASFTLDRDEVEYIGSIGHEQNRPRAIHHHAGSGQLFVGTVPDYGRIGGALASYDPITDSIEVERNIVNDQSISSLASINDTLFAGSEIHGGNGTEPVADEARLLALTVDEWNLRWKSIPVSGAEAISNLETSNDQLFAGTTAGDIVRIDPDDGTTVDRKNIALDTGFGQVGTKLVALDGALYGLVSSTVFHIDPETLTTTSIAKNIVGENPVLASYDGSLYVADGHDLLRLNPRIAE